LKALIKQIDIKYSQKANNKIHRKKIILEIEQFEEFIENAKKSTLEKIIQIISLGIITYNKKYAIIIAENRKNILKLENDLTTVSNDMKILNNDIKNLENKFVNEYKALLIKFQNSLLSISKNRYINNYLRIELSDKLHRLIQNKEKFLYHDDIKDSITETIKFHKSSKRWVTINNKLFIKNERIKEKSFFDTVELNPLTYKQQEAVLVNENNNLILAGAGSGKTSVIVAKVIYLLKKRILHPNEILILAFNKNAQQELEERLEGKNIHVKVKTFHSFGLSVVAQEFSQKLNLCPTAESQNNMTKFIKDTIRNLMSSSNIFLETFITFIAYFKIPYKNESDFKIQGDYYDYQNSCDMKSLKHEVVEKGKNNENLTTLKEETVKSHQELVIANFLTLNGIRYLYEEPYKYKTYTEEKRQYKPDFYLPEYDIYIEHFGIDRNNKTAPFVNNREYLEGIKWKNELHKEKHTTLVQTFSYEFSENNLLEKLKDKLLAHNVSFRELEFAEIAELLKEPIENNEFTKLFTTFLNHYKSNMNELDNLKNKKEVREVERTSLFLKIFEFIFNEYQKYQERNNCIDFDDMIVKALNSVNIGEYEHGFKHIFIDEFQDISTTRAKLIKALLPLNKTSITAVGDDWQSINRFAGSNIRIIQDFEKTFGISETVALDYTFRFNNIVSKVASNFVEKNPHQIKKEIKTIKNQDTNKFSILLYWNSGDSKFDLEYILHQISSKEKKKKKVMVLARYNFLLNDLRVLKSKYLNLDIIFSTVHGSKGNEADYVIVLGLDKGKFGFPSKIEDDPILNIVIPKGDDFEDAEERRLFYVALTRTKGTLFLSSDMYKKSPFIEELIAENQDELYFINDPKIKLQNCPTCKTGFLKKRVTSQNRKNHFYGCSNFPRCKYTENIHYCPNCKNEMLEDKQNNIAKCSSNKCDFISVLCVKCSGYMIERKGKYGDFLGCSKYPKCNYSKKLHKEIA